MGKSVLIYHVEWFVRILIAAICGCCIGYERSSRNKGAGIRTHAILALGSALMVLISKYGFCDFKNIDGSRLAAQIVSGVGFLGAGVIFVRHGTVSGLTTAAGMWATSGVGMCIGCGLYDLGIISTFLIVGLQTLFHRGFFLRMTQNTIKVRLEVLYRKNLIYDIENLFSNNNLNIIYGKNESGKSTILELLLRFYEPEEGEILCNGENIKVLKLSEYRSLFSVVSQKSALFLGDIVQNIDLEGKADRQKLNEVLRKSGVKKYLQRFPEKEKTQIGDDGAFLSGGERQKLVVARALLKDAPVMLFDEASSGFDVEANEYLYKIITEEMPEKSVIFITHHYDKLEKFDKVYLVKDGFLTEVRTGKM